MDRYSLRDACSVGFTSRITPAHSRAFLNEYANRVPDRDLQDILAHSFFEPDVHSTTDHQL